METRRRVLAFLRGELARLEAERDEIVLLLEVLAEPPGVSTGAENALREDEGERLPPVEQLPPPQQLPPGRQDTDRNNGVLNRRLIVHVLRERGAFVEARGDYSTWLSTQELMDRTGLSNSTVGKHMRALLDEGRVERVLRSNAGIHNGGRAPWTYRLLPVVEEREHHIDLTNGLVD